MKLIKKRAFFLFIFPYFLSYKILPNFNNLSRFENQLNEIYLYNAQINEIKNVT